MPESTGGKVKNCKQAPSCKVKEDGKCLEGLELNVCPHFYLEDSQVEPKTGNGKSDPKIELFSGEELRLKDLPLVTNKYKTRTVVIVGDWKAGKSTLLTSIFDHLQIGYFNDFLFAGSVTQIGFEKRCHPSRIASGAEEPITERTKLLDFNFLHLGLKRADSLHQEPTHLLLSDVSGETFKQARDSSARMQSLSLIKTVDFVLIMLDGRRLADIKTRESTLMSMKTFIFKAIEEGIFTKDTNIKIVVSKWDLLHNEKSFNYSSQIEQYFDSEFREQLPKTNYHKVVSRTKYSNGEIKSGYGLSDLLDEWTKRFETSTTTSKPVSNSERNFDKYRVQ